MNFYKSLRTVPRTFLNIFIEGRNLKKTWTLIRKLLVILYFKYVSIQNGDFEDVHNVKV